jgi:hypothetical protein
MQGIEMNGAVAAHISAAGEKVMQRHAATKSRSEARQSARRMRAFYGAKL